MEKIGIISAMRTEMDLILEEMENLNETKYLGFLFYEGFINDIEIVLVESGVGKVNASMATTILISEFSCDLILNTGIAGGLPGVKTKDVILATGLSWYDFDIRIFGYEYGQVPQMPKIFPINPELIMLVKSTLNKLNIESTSGLILSGDKFVSDLSLLEQCKNMNALACEMEGCAVAQVSLKAGVDFLVLRYISDVIGEPSQNDDYLKFEDEMARRSALIAISLIKNL